MHAATGCQVHISIDLSLQAIMASSSTALDADCIEEDDGTSEPVLTEAHVRDVFSHWEAGTPRVHSAAKAAAWKAR